MSSSATPSGSISTEERPGGLFACQLQRDGIPPAKSSCIPKSVRKFSRAGELAANEAWRVEHKYSRYRNDSVVAWIHQQRGQVCGLDP